MAAVIVDLVPLQPKKKELRGYPSSSELYRPRATAAGEVSAKFCGLEVVAW
jgi:hypothetical protein